MSGILAGCLMDVTQWICVSPAPHPWSVWQFIVNAVRPMTCRSFCQSQRNTLCLKKNGPLRIIWLNFTNSQRLLIIFGRERPYSVLNWYDEKFLNWFRTSCIVAIATVVTTHPNGELLADFQQCVISRAVNEWENNCGPVSRPKDCTSNTCNFCHRTLFQ